MDIFNLPDLGEGLPDVEIVEWHINTGDRVEKDQALVSVETAKAIVEIPSPQSGTIQKLFGSAGDIIETGDPLVEFKSSANTRLDTGTVVGEVKVGKKVVEEKPAIISLGLVAAKTTPAVRALAHQMDVDLSIVTPTGSDETITSSDIQRVAKILEEVGPMEPLRGVRRTMARSMAQAHAEVVPVTVSDDADIENWPADTDITLRLIRSLIAGCSSEPSLNTWYDSHAMGRRVLKKIDLGIAIDTEEGLFVPVLRDVANRDEGDLRRGLDDMKTAVEARKIPPEEMRGFTITLSNFGTFCGRYADPVVMPPTVAILGAGKIRPEVVVGENNTPVVHRILPISLTFDHRAVTGGEATRFLAAVLKDLEMES